MDNETIVSEEIKQASYHADKDARDRRDRFAAAALTGFLASGSHKPQKGWGQRISRLSRTFADRMIRVLDEEPTSNPAEEEAAP